MIDVLNFMSGDWLAEIHGGEFEESWSAPRGGTMVGHGRLIVGGATKFMEFLSVEADRDGRATMYIVLGALSKGDKTPIVFSLQEQAADRALFVRNGDDFPVSICYERQGVRLMCTLSGPGKEPEIYDFRRVLPT